MFNIHDRKRDAFMLTGPFARKGYDWWWHDFTAVDEETGEEKTFFIEFFTCNPALGGKEPVFGQLAENQKNHVKPSYLMVKCGTWGRDAVQLHWFFGWDDVKVSKGAPYRIEAGDCLASETQPRGSVSVSYEDAKKHPEWMSDGGSMSFDLHIEKQTAFNVGYGASSLFRFLKAFEMYWHAEGMKSTYRGTVTFNGRRYTVVPERSYGYADKNWGRGFTSPWVWLSSCDLYSMKQKKKLENSVFDIGGGRPKAFGIAMDRKLLGVLYLEGKEYEFNFSKFWMKPGTEFSEEETEEEVIWHVIQTNRNAKMVTEARCQKKDMLLFNYEAPDGTKRHNHLWNGGTGTALIRLYEMKNGKETLIDELHAGHVGCEYGEYDK
jgi:tocopherol cyclase